MVSINVIVLRRGTPKPIASWRFETGGRVVTQDGGAPLSPEEVWRQLALTIHELACEASQEQPYSNFQADVFLLVCGRLPEHLYDIDDVERIVKGARYHNWGGNIYLAWEGSTETDFKSLNQHLDAVLEAWFRGLVGLGLTDLIEIPWKEYAAEPDVNKLLYRSALKSEERLQRLRGLAGDEAWRVVLRDHPFSPIESFIKKFIGEATGSDQAIFFDGKPSLLDLAQMLDKSHGPEHGGKQFIGVRSFREESGLEALLDREFPGERPFYFNSILEWLYSFLRLNPVRRTAASVPRAGRAEGEADVRWVTPRAEGGIRLRPNDGDIRLLVTCAFHTERSKPLDLDRDQAGWYAPTHWLHASNEIGEVLSRLPFRVQVEVHHDITCERLPHLLNDKSFTAWLHLGHGKRGKGLKEEMTGQFVSVERWRGCFKNYEGSLQLIVFSACESAEAAEAFAHHGVPVVVGFEEEVLTLAARQLSAMVIPAALRPGNRQAHLIEVFRAAAEELGKVSYAEENEDGVLEDKVYGAAGPRAFAARLNPQ